MTEFDNLVALVTGGARELCRCRCATGRARAHVAVLDVHEVRHCVVCDVVIRTKSTPRPLIAEHFRSRLVINNAGSARGNIAANMTRSASRLRRQTSSSRARHRRTAFPARSDSPRSLTPARSSRCRATESCVVFASKSAVHQSRWYGCRQCEKVFE